MKNKSIKSIAMLSILSLTMIIFAEAAVARDDMTIDDTITGIVESYETDEFGHITSFEINGITITLRTSSDTIDRKIMGSYDNDKTITVKYQKLDNEYVFRGFIGLPKQKK